MTYFRMVALGLALSAPFGIAMYGSSYAAGPKAIDTVNPAGARPTGPTPSGPKPTHKNVRHPREEVGCPGGKRITTTCEWVNGHVVCHPAGSCW